MDAARHFTRGIKARNHLAVLVEHFGIGVDLDAAHRMVNGRHLARKVPGTFRHRAVVGVVGLEAEAVRFHFVGSDLVVFVDSSLQVVVVDAHHLRGFLKGLGLLHAALLEHVLHLAAREEVNFVFIRVAQMILQQPVGLAGLREDSLAQHVARRAFVDEAVAILIDEEAVAARGLDVEHEARARRAVRVNLNVGEADQICVDLFGHDEAVALRSGADVGAADFLVELRFLPDAGVELLAEFDVGAEAARGDDDALVAVDLHGLAVVLRLNADDAAVFLNEVEGLRFEKDMDAVAVFFERLFKRRDIGVAARRIRIVRALIERARGCAYLRVHDEAHAFEPAERFGRMVGEVVHEFGVVGIVAALHRLLKMLLRIVFDAEGLLIFRAGSVERAAADIRGAAEVAELFNDRDRCAVFKSRNRCRKAGAAATDNHDVRLHFIRERRLHSHLLEEALVCAGFLERLANALKHRKARHRCARDAVDAGALRVNNALRENADRFFADARAFERIGHFNLLDAPVLKRYRNGEGRNEAHHLFVVGAVLGCGAGCACRSCERTNDARQCLARNFRIHVSSPLSQWSICRQAPAVLNRHMATLVLVVI